MAFTLEQLRGFLAVAEELHFARAATRLQMTQPPLSRQIQKLEKTVGAQLLERDNRRVALTGAGAAFLDEAYRLLNERVTGAQVDGIRRGELDLGLARPPFDTSLLRSRVILREPLMAVVPAGHRLASLSRPPTPDDFEGEAVIGYHPDQSRYFHE